MFYGHFTHIFHQNTQGPCLKHIINQTTINLDIRLYYVVVEITDYSFIKIKLILGDFENLDIPCLTAGDLTCLVRPHSFSIAYFSYLCSNIPSSPAYNVYILQLIRFARACSTCNQFLFDGGRLTNALMLQSFIQSPLQAALRKSYDGYNDVALRKSYDGYNDLALRKSYDGYNDVALRKSYDGYNDVALRKSYDGYNDVVYQQYHPLGPMIFDVSHNNC
jgi:hypothetical protein